MARSDKSAVAKKTLSNPYKLPTFRLFVLVDRDGKYICSYSSLLTALEEKGAGENLFVFENCSAPMDESVGNRMRITDLDGTVWEDNGAEEKN